MSTSEMTEDRRREVFASLVSLQDSGCSVAESRLAVSERFGLTEEELLGIERDGIASHWPPLEG